MVIWRTGCWGYSKVDSCPIGSFSWLPKLIEGIGLCRRRGWRDPLYETYKGSQGFTCLVLVNGREYQTDLTYESDGLAQENAAMRAFMVCRNFSVNGGMLARNGIVQGLPANEGGSSRRRQTERGVRTHSVNLSSSSSSSTSSEWLYDQHWSIPGED